jgi:hypothetical protein
MTTDDAPTYRSELRWESLPWWEREHITNFGRTTAGQFYPKFAGGDRCDRSGCPDNVEGRGRRFCATHRQEHGQRLLAQLQAITNP